GWCEQAGPERVLQIVAGSAVRRALIIDAREAFDVRARDTPAGGRVDGGRILTQIEIVVQTAVVAAVGATVAQHAVCPCRVDKQGIAGHTVPILGRVPLPTGQSILIRAVPESEVRQRGRAHVEVVIVACEAELTVRGNKETVAPLNPK